MTISALRAGSAVLLAVSGALSATAPASADPWTSLLCQSGSSQYCAPAQAPTAPRNAPAVPAQPPQAVRAYRNCTEVWDAGAGPIRRGDPGYAAHLDRDGDGVGCEKDPR